MNVLFIHSHIFQTDQNGVVYSSGGQFPYPRWKRYLDHFDNLIVIGRVHKTPTEQLEGLDRSSGSCVSFEWAPDLNELSTLFINRNQAKTIIKQAIAKVDAVIIRLSGLGWLAAAEAERQGKPWAVEVVGDPWDAYWNYGNWRARAFAPIAWSQAKYWISKAPFAMYVTKSTLQSRYPCKGHVSYASNVEIDPPNGSVLMHRLEREHLKSNNGSKIIFGLIGSLKHRYKGIHVALKTLGGIRENLSNFEFRILGAGDPSPWKTLAAQHSLSDHVIFDGVLPSGKPVLNWLNNIDIYLQPSFQEGLPRTLIEAMSRGCPALGSTAGGIPELLDEECLHRPGDCNALQKQILKLVNNINWRMHQSERNFEVAKEYGKGILEHRRNIFWGAFAEYSRKQAQNCIKLAVKETNV